MIKQLKKIWGQVVERSRHVHLPFFQGLSLYQVMSFFFKGISEGRITNRAGSAAYSFFLALFPGVIFLFTLIPYFQIDGLQKEVFEVFQQVLPPDTYDSVRSTIDDILNNKRGGLLSFGFFLALIFATNGINALISNMNVTIHEIETRNFWRQHLVSLMLTFCLSILFILGIVLIIFSSTVINSIFSFLELEKVSPFMVDISRYLLLIAITLFAIAILYSYGPAKKREWQFLSPGAILATVLILVSSWGFSFYVSNFSQYNKLYGSIGTVMVILLWIYINALVLIIGFELNASIASAKVKNQEKEDLELELG